MPLTLTGAAQLQTPACASYKLWQQGRALKFGLKPCFVDQIVTAFELPSLSDWRVELPEKLKAIKDLASEELKVEGRKQRKKN